MLSLLQAAKKDRVVAAALVSFLAGAGYVLYKKIAIPGRVVNTRRNGGDLVAAVLQAHGACALPPLPPRRVLVPVSLM